MNEIHEEDIHKLNITGEKGTEYTKESVSKATSFCGHIANKFVS